MSGNVWEWTAMDSEAGMRVVHGGSYRDDGFSLEAVADGDRNLLLRDPTYEDSDVGMRVGIINVPEPSGLLMILSGTLGLGLLNWISLRRQS
jgi:hypothetical protein